MILNENASRQGTHLLIATGAPIELTRTQRKRDWNQPDSLELQQQKIKKIEFNQLQILPYHNQLSMN